jgi:hypothetical protein
MEGGDRDGTPVLDARADELTIDLLGGSEPTGAPAEAPRPEVLAALPVREDNWADDPQGAPGNGIRQALFADPPRGTTADARVSAPAETGSPADAGGYQGPLFTEPDPTGSPADAAPVSADGDAHDLPLGDLSGAGGRAWRPGNN